MVKTEQKDFQGQDLRGRSFRNQDLANANFSNAKLGGVDFTNAKLDGAVFRNAKFGYSRMGQFLQIAIEIFFSIYAFIAILLLAMVVALFTSSFVDGYLLLKNDSFSWVIGNGVIVIFFGVVILLLPAKSGKINFDDLLRKIIYFSLIFGSILLFLVVIAKILEQPWDDHLAVIKMFRNSKQSYWYVFSKISDYQKETVYYFFIVISLVGAICFGGLMGFILKHLRWWKYGFNSGMVLGFNIFIYSVSFWFFEKDLWNGFLVGASLASIGLIGVILIYFSCVAITSVCMLAIIFIIFSGAFVRGRAGSALIFIGYAVFTLFAIYTLDSDLFKGKLNSHATIVFLFIPPEMYLLSRYIKNAALVDEHPQLSFLRQWHILVACVGGAKITSRRISNVIFDKADLMGTKLQVKKLISCSWEGAKNLNLANLNGTILEPQKVRNLLTKEIAGNSNFEGVNLNGISLIGRNLREYDFSDCNLADADFSGSDLRDAVLVAANVTGARFSGAKLTGAIIENWNIDPSTVFDEEIECDYVWLGLKSDSYLGQRERNPPEGKFQMGEFAKLYQQVADTIDFILHNRDELDAINRSIAHLQANGVAIEVESVERKNSSVVVRLKAPPGVSREQVHSEVKHEFDLQLALAEKTVQMLTDERDRLSTLLIGMSQRQSNVYYQQGNYFHKGDNMSDNRNTQIIQDSTISHSAVNFGDHANITNSIAQLPEAQIELKALLTQLYTLISNSRIQSGDKKDALFHTEIIVEEAKQIPVLQANRVRRALGFIEQIFTGIEDVGGTASRISELISKIGGILGL